ncbi:MAG: sialate O-acetylesterase [Limisphaerales bacterium]
MKHAIQLIPLFLLVTSAASHPVSAASGPVKVFILAGQSNMEGHGRIQAEPRRHVGQGSLEFLVKDPATARRFAPLVDTAGRWRARGDVWITYLDCDGPLIAGFGAHPGETIGPELGFGWVMGDALDAPVLLIKCAWGGRSLAVDFRPPSAGKLPYSLGEKDDAALAQEPDLLGKYYRETLALTRTALDRVKELVPGSDGSHVLAGFGWHQGWNDRINDQFNTEYESNMAHFVRDLRRDLGAPALPFVIAETGMTGPNEKDPGALSSMKALAAVAERAEFKGNVAFVGTRGFWRPEDQSPRGQDYHWNSNAETYWLIGDAMGRAMLPLTGVAATPSGRGGSAHLRRDLEGWTVWVNPALLDADERPATEQALALLAKQLAGIRRVVPTHHVSRLQEVPLWFNPPYDGVRPTAEYHPDAGWLRANRRDPAMARAVEFTNTLLWEGEDRRMPMLALHELAHAFHDRVLGHEHAGILDAFAAAKSSGAYDHVKRWTGDEFTTDRAYALNNEQEYFAETTEAFFGRNDFEPFDRAELQAKDPKMYDVLQAIWK